MKPLDDAHAKAIDAFARDAASRLDVPGAAYAVIVGHDVVHEGFVGVRALGANAPVTPHTLFMLGSITKPITTLMEATLVDAGIVRWDTPLVALLPSFAVDDPARTRDLVLWHASCACSGIGSEDVESFFTFGDATPESRIAAMRRLKPFAPIGAKYFYSNAMVALGGYAAAHAAMPNVSLGEAYARVLRERVLEPIGMPSSTVDFGAVEKTEHASPHATALDGTVREIPLDYEKDVLSIDPAGGLWTDLHDMERYVATEMADGVTPEGKRIVSRANLEERRKLRIVSDGDEGYGLGIDVGTYDGAPVFAHDGGAHGFGASMLIFRDSSVAIVVLTNVRNGGPFALLPFNRVVERKIVDALFDGPDDRAASMLDSFVNARRELGGKATAGVEREPASTWLESIAGTYTHPLLGDVTIVASPHGGTLDAGEWRSAFGKRTANDGTAKLVLLDPPFAGGAIGVEKNALVVDTTNGPLTMTRKSPR